MIMFFTIIHGGNYSSEETIQRRKLFKGGNYMRKYGTCCRECIRIGAAGARTSRSLGHHLFHPQILRLLVLLKPADFEAQSSLL
jgi:hypothetical protein